MKDRWDVGLHRVKLVHTDKRAAYPYLWIGWTDGREFETLDTQACQELQQALVHALPRKDGTPTYATLLSALIELYEDVCETSVTAAVDVEKARDVIERAGGVV